MGWNLFLGALILLLGLVHRLDTWLPPTLFFISLSWAAYLLFSIAGHVSFDEIAEFLTMKTREVEEAWEIGDFLLVALWAAIALLFLCRFQV